MCDVMAVSRISTSCVTSHSNDRLQLMDFHGAIELYSFPIVTCHSWKLLLQAHGPPGGLCGHFLTMERHSRVTVRESLLMQPRRS
jgi:hypothetical protein